MGAKFAPAGIDLFDLLMPLTGLWMTLAPSAVDGLSEALVKGGVIVLDFVVAYAAMACQANTDKLDLFAHP